jgi:Glycosyl transferase family 2
MKSATIITPTIGTKHLSQCIMSVKNQTVPVKHLIVIDGKEHFNDADWHFQRCGEKTIDYILLVDNVGANGWYGHRIYAAFTYLVNTDYVMYLDEDNWIEPNHIESLMDILNKNKHVDWAFSLRTIVDKEGNFICRDDCESLGKITGHVDTSAFFVPTSMAKNYCHAWMAQWGADRRFYGQLSGIPHISTGLYTLNYRLDSSPTSPKKEFFLEGNDNVYKALGEKPFWNKEPD